MNRACLLFLALAACSDIEWVPDPPFGMSQNAWAHEELYGQFWTPRPGVTGPIWIDHEWHELERRADR